MRSEIGKSHPNLKILRGGVGVAPPTGAHGLISAHLEQHFPEDTQWEPQVQFSVYSCHVKKKKKSKKKR